MPALTRNADSALFPHTYAKKGILSVRLNEFLPPEKVDLKSNDWRTVQLAFLGEKVNVSIDGKLRSK